MSDLDTKVFDNKTLSDLYKEIYQNSKKKDKLINQFIEELSELVKDVGDANLVVPLIKSYLEMGIKNDDQLVKMTAIIQKSLTATSFNSDGHTLSEEEKEELLSTLEESKKELKKLA